jgi:hypothetical protein
LFPRNGNAAVSCPAENSPPLKLKVNPENEIRKRNKRDRNRDKTMCETGNESYANGITRFHSCREGDHGKLLLVGRTAVVLRIRVWRTATISSQKIFFGVQPMDEKNFSTFLFTGLD